MVEFKESSYDSIKDIFLDPLNRDYFSNNFESKYGNCNECEFFTVINRGERIGGVILHDYDEYSNRIMFTISLDTKYQNMGLGYKVMRSLLTYLFDKRKIRKVFLEVYETNRRAIKLYEKLGFRKEGILKKHTFKNGEYINLIIMSLLNHEHETYYVDKGGV